MTQGTGPHRTADLRAAANRKKREQLQDDIGDSPTQQSPQLSCQVSASGYLKTSCPYKARVKTGNI